MSIVVILPLITALPAATALHLAMHALPTVLLASALLNV